MFDFEFPITPKRSFTALLFSISSGTRKRNSHSIFKSISKNQIRLGYFRKAKKQQAVPKINWRKENEK
jgi:hypothetical protein